MSELLSGPAARSSGVPHEVLNAKQHEREAHIVAQAGPSECDHDRHQHGRSRHRHRARRQPRGRTGGACARTPPQSERDRIKAEWQKRHDEVVALGGLRIIGTERHESRRIDNQLRGRSGRQGDPGSSRFYLSLEDNLIRIFMGEGVARLMRMFGMKEDDAIEDKMVSRQIEKAQRKVEAHNFDIRKHLLEFDDTANDQRKVIYEQRNELLDSDERRRNDRRRSASDVFTELVRRFMCRPTPSTSNGTSPACERELESEFGLKLDLKHWLEEQDEADADTSSTTCSKTSTACSARRKRWSAPKSCARSKST